MRKDALDRRFGGTDDGSEISSVSLLQACAEDALRGASHGMPPRTCEKTPARGGPRVDTLEAIGWECGFGTRSNFYRAFNMLIDSLQGIELPYSSDEYEEGDGRD